MYWRQVMSAAIPWQLGLELVYKICWLLALANRHANSHNIHIEPKRTAIDFPKKDFYPFCLLCAKGEESYCIQCEDQQGVFRVVCLL